MNLICPPIHSFENSFNEFNRSNHTFASYDSMCINTTAPITQFVLLPFNRKIMYARGGTTIHLHATWWDSCAATHQNNHPMQNIHTNILLLFLPSHSVIPLSGCGRCAAIPHQHTSQPGCTEHLSTYCIL